MRTIPLGLTNNFPPSTTPYISSPSSSSASTPKSSFSFSSNKFRLSSTPKHPGICLASQFVDLFPAISPEIVVREARLEDCWDIAETHCSSFFPEYSFPLDFVLRLDRLIAMVFGLSVPNGCKRTCLVAVVGGPSEDTFFIGSEDLKLGGVEGKFCLNRSYVAGILTVDTVADFLPRKGPLRQRRCVTPHHFNIGYILSVVFFLLPMEPKSSYMAYI
ncbi:hypothetical protein RND81_03G090000 [Saponaria officinalis]|uniref:Acyl-CoA N-acyltransferase n=1 Tax=Saponaria officinalis TaxID=3572 RepID=A0AAW1M640_SAPOF